MKNRNDLLEEKRNSFLELINPIISDGMSDGYGSSDIFRALQDCDSIRMTPPQEPPVMMSLLTLDSLSKYKGGSSIKPGNIIVNIKALMDSLPEIVASAVGIVMDNPILKVCSLLSIWKTLRNSMTVKIEKEHAVVIISLWKHRNGNYKITFEDGFKYSKKLYNEYYDNDLSYEAYSNIIDDFVKIESIEWNEGEIWLREWISQEYR
jgi:hypothetical protein